LKIPKEALAEFTTKEELPSKLNILDTIKIVRGGRRGVVVGGGGGGGTGV